MIHRTALVVFLMAVGCLPALARTWTDRTGKFRTEATLVTVKDGRAYLERSDGRVVPVPLQQLSVADLQHLATLPAYEASVAPLLPSPAAAKPAPVNTAAIHPARAVRPTVRIDDESESGAVRRFESGTWGISALDFSPDGAMLAMGRMDRAITLIDVESSQVLSLHEKLNSLSSVTCMTFSSEGSRLLVGGQSGVVQVWTVDPTRRLVLESEFKVHDSAVEAIAISHDNGFALSSERSHKARYWKIATGEEVFGWEGFTGSVKGVFLSRRGEQALITDGQLLALAELDKGQVRQTMPAAEGSGQSLAIAPDGSLIAVNDSYAMHVWEIRTGKRLPVFQDNEIQWAATFSPNGRYLISSGNARINVWSIATGQRVHQFTASDSGYVRCLAFSPDNIHFAATCGPLGQTVQVFRLPRELRRGR